MFIAIVMAFWACVAVICTAALFIYAAIVLSPIFWVGLAGFIFLILIKAVFAK